MMTHGTTLFDPENAVKLRELRGVVFGDKMLCTDSPEPGATLGRFLGRCVWAAAPFQRLSPLRLGLALLRRRRGLLALRGAMSLRLRS